MLSCAIAVADVIPQPLHMELASSILRNGLRRFVIVSPRQKILMMIPILLLLNELLLPILVIKK